MGAGECSELIPAVIELPCAPTDCDRPVAMAEAGSDLVDGHGFLVGFFLPADAFASTAVECGTSFCEDDDAVAVEVDEADDATDEDELLRWTPLRGRNIRDTSSVLMLFKWLGLGFPACHAGRGTD